MGEKDHWNLLALRKNKVINRRATVELHPPPQDKHGRIRLLVDFINNQNSPWKRKSRKEIRVSKHHLPIHHHCFKRCRYETLDRKTSELKTLRSSSYFICALDALNSQSPPPPRQCEPLLGFLAPGLLEWQELNSSEQMQRGKWLLVCENKSRQMVALTLTEQWTSDNQRCFITSFPCSEQ